MEKEEFKIIFENHFDNLRRYIVYRSGDAELANDIAQDTFLKFWEKRSSVKQKTSKGLLFKIANDLYISRYRKEKLEKKYLQNFILNTEDASPQEKMEFDQLKSDYEKSLAKMGENQRVVFLMSRADGYTYSEIAENLNISVKAVEKRMKLAISCVRQILNRNE